MIAKPPTLDDVALAAGVSAATISRCINSPERVAESTRLRVQAAIDKLGYTPNFGGRALATRRTNIIGAVIPSMANAIFAGGIQAFQEVLARDKVTLLIGSSNYDPDYEFEQIQTLLSHGADGLLLVGSKRPERTEQFLTSRRIPTLNVWCFRPDPGQLFVGFDNVRAGADMAQLVVDYGHRAVAIVSGICDGNDRAADRLDGMRAVLDAPTNGAQMVIVHQTKYSFEHAARAFDTVIAQSPRPTAILAGNDVLAAGLIQRAKELGFSVPGDVSITGFDDIALAQFIEPGLTTVRVPQVQMGQRAAEELLAEIREPGTGRSVELLTHIVKRGSLAPPKA
jgi:LacI family transcriptional regulator